jgi:hypothetical protein
MIEGIFGKHWKDWDENARLTFYNNETDKEIKIPNTVFGEFLYVLCVESFPIRRENVL